MKNAKHPPAKASFIPPMLLIRSSKLPADGSLMRELKFDGYRAIAFKSDNTIRLRSRNDKDFGTRFPEIAKALQSLPDNTVVDGEVVALDEGGRPSFNLLQNYKSSGAQLVFYIFDLLILSGRQVMEQTLTQRRDLLERKVLPKLNESIRYSRQRCGPKLSKAKALKAWRQRVSCIAGHNELHERMVVSRSSS